MQLIFIIFQGCYKKVEMLINGLLMAHRWRRQKSEKARYDAKGGVGHHSS